MAFLDPSVNRSLSIVECVPNFSEGRDRGVVDGIARAIEMAGAAVLDRTSDWDHNRSVVTFAGSPEAVEDAAFAAVEEAVKRIDLSRHAGVHPRAGAADVVPFIPVRGATLEDCAAIARRVGERIWDRLGVPVYLYEAAARSPDRAALEAIRREIRREAGSPDIGSGTHPTAGATVAGARKFLIAWNINLQTDRLEAARTIARKIRFSSGGLPCVKALGLPLASRNQVQVSMNLTDFERTPLHIVYEAVSRAAGEQGIEIAGSELIGLIPAKALEISAGYDLHWQNFRPEMILENRLADTILAGRMLADTM
ncbi:MAG: glutamate formimidoyltransferase [Acidobacteriota bacterium]|nr:glutamate formimidoyltransferase [Acidobacteriota bacterium]